MIKLDFSFMKNWKNLSSIESNAIKTLQKGVKIILKNIPKESIVSIYLAGSFPRREMNKKSDVDTYTIVNDSKYLENLQQLDKKYHNTMTPNFGFSGYSIEELKTGKLSEKGKKMRPGTARFVRMLPTYALIYGKEPDLSSFYQKTDLEHLTRMIKTFDDIFFPYYEQGKIGFQDLLKQALWLFELEIAVKNNNFRFESWGNLISYFDNKHLIHKVMELRDAYVKDEKIKIEFVKKLKEYIKRLKRRYKPLIIPTKKKSL